MKFLHLADNEAYIPKGQPGYDALFKLQPFLQPLIANFQAAYTPNREMSVDEAMIGFNGMLSFMQYLPNKPTKWGMKAYVLADSRTGYVYNWKLSTGIYMYMETQAHMHVHMRIHACIYMHVYTCCKSVCACIKYIIM